MKSIPKGFVPLTDSEGQPWLVRADDIHSLEISEHEKGRQMVGVTTVHQSALVRESLDEVMALMINVVGTD